MAKVKILINNKPVEVEETKAGLFGQLGYQYVDENKSTSLTPATSSTPPTQTTPISSYIPTGASASFLADTSKILEKIGDIGTQMSSVYPSPAETEATLSKQKELTKEETKTEYEAARQDILKQADWARQELAPLREQAFSTPALSKRNLDAYSLKVEKLTDQVNSTIEKLTKEEQRALENLDLEYADKIRQAKVDYLNFQQKLLENSFNLLTQRFNIQQTIASEQRQSGATILEQILNTYSGQGLNFDSLPLDVRMAAQTTAYTLGIPLSVIKSQIQSKQADLQIVREGDYTSIYDKKTGELVKKYYAPSASASQIKISDLSKITDEEFKKELSQKGYVDVNTYFAHLSTWQSEAPDKVKWFFLNYPLDVYVPTTTSQFLTKNEKDLREKIKQISDEITSRSVAASLAGLMDGIWRFLEPNPNQ